MPVCAIAPPAVLARFVPTRVLPAPKVVVPLLNVVSVVPVVAETVRLPAMAVADAVVPAAMATLRSFLSMTRTAPMGAEAVTSPLKSLPASPRVMPPDNAVMVVVPPTPSGAVWLTAAAVVTRFVPTLVGPKVVGPPLMVVRVVPVPSLIIKVPLVAVADPAFPAVRTTVSAFASTTVTLPAPAEVLGALAVSKPTKSFPALASVTLPPVEETDVVPVIFSAAVCAWWR